jgi:uncharacterized sulfatase
VFTADHGELFGKQNLITHKFLLDDALTHVPLVTYGLEDISDQTENVVQHIDVMKTILSQRDIRHSQIRGTDLTSANRHYAVSQRSGARTQKNLAAIREYNQEYEVPSIPTETLTALRSTEFKYLYSSKNKKLFKLPDEQTDVTDQYPEIADQFHEYARDWLETHETDHSSQQRSGELDPVMREHLSDMGYIQ